jgi:hypothetical protein
MSCSERLGSASAAPMPNGWGPVRCPSLVGERLAPGTPIHLVDDLVYSGDTLCAAVALRQVDLFCTSASAILWTRRAEAAEVALEACGLQQVTRFASQTDMPE